MENQGEIINRRGSIHPIFRLSDLFAIPTEVTHPSEGILIIVESARGHYCIQVDELLGQQQVVVKDLGPQFKSLICVAGSAILGDGRLGLVLDVDGIIKMAHGGE